MSQPKRARASDQVIQVGDIVMGRVTRINTRQASVEIIYVGETVLREPHKGIVRKEVSLLAAARRGGPDMITPNDRTSLVSCAQRLSVGRRIHMIHACGIVSSFHEPHTKQISDQGAWVVVRQVFQHISLGALSGTQLCTWCSRRVYLPLA